MRFYDISLTPPGASKPVRQWQSHPNGIFDPAALDVEFDCQIASYATSAQVFTITINGASLQDISQAYQFGSQIVDGVQQPGMTLVMQGGMKAGLPLANPAQAGILVQGEVIQAYGNWEGVNMSLSLVVVPSPYTLDNPGNFVLNWQSGQTLADALQQTLSTALPGTPVVTNISSQLVQNFDEVHFCSTLQELTQCVQGITNGYFLGDSYRGVGITAQNGQISVWDGTFTSSQVQIAYTDFVGQPAWLDQNTMIMKLVLRADLQLGTVVTMPKGLQNQPGAVATQPTQLYPSNSKYQAAFQGTFQISELRHIGSYRSPEGAAWVTIAKCLTPNT